MKQQVVVGALIGAFAAGPAFQLNAAAQGANGGRGRLESARLEQTPTQAGGGHTAPKAQPATEPAPTAPQGQMALGTVRIPKAVKADGKPLAAGTYEVRLTTETAGPDARGATASLERWAEFVKGGKVVGREVVTVIPQADVSKVQKDTPPASGGSKVETLKGGDYIRVWINRSGNHYLMHLPV